jgi:tetratricopeptide (TPR) repeat protein
MRLRVFLISVALMAAMATAAAAQTAPNPSPAPSPNQTPPEKPPLDTPDKKDWVAPPANPPKPQHGDRTRNLDFLFGALKVAPDDASAKHIEDRIWALWLASGSDTANLLMSRAKAAIEGKDYDLAVRLLDAVIEIRPQYVEAWDQRATVFFLKKDYASALADLRQVLRREPRHFGALFGLGAIMQDVGDDKEALDAYRRAYALHPHLKGLADKVRVLTEKVEGRDI